MSVDFKKLSVSLLGQSQRRIAGVLSAEVHGCEDGSLLFLVEQRLPTALRQTSSGRVALGWCVQLHSADVWHTVMLHDFFIVGKTSLPSLNALAEITVGTLVGSAREGADWKFEHPYEISLKEVPPYIPRCTAVPPLVVLEAREYADNLGVAWLKRLCEPSADLASETDLGESIPFVQGCLELKALQNPGKATLANTHRPIDSSSTLTARAAAFCVAKDLATASELLTGLADQILSRFPSVENSSAMEIPLCETLGDLFVQLGDLTSAVRLFRRIVTHREDAPTVFRKLLAAVRRGGAPAISSQEILEFVQQLRPEWLDASDQEAVGDLLLECQETKAALEAYIQAFRMDGSHWLPLVKATRLWVSTGVESGLYSLDLLNRERANDKREDRALVLGMQARLWAACGRWDLADRKIAQAMTLAPEHPVLAIDRDTVTAHQTTDRDVRARFLHSAADRCLQVGNHEREAHQLLQELHGFQNLSDTDALVFNELQSQLGLSQRVKGLTSVNSEAIPNESKPEGEDQFLRGLVEMTLSQAVSDRVDIKSASVAPTGALVPTPPWRHWAKAFSSEELSWQEVERSEFASEAERHMAFQIAVLTSGQLSVLESWRYRSWRGMEGLPYPLSGRLRYSAVVPPLAPVQEIHDLLMGHGREWKKRLGKRTSLEGQATHHRLDAGKLKSEGRVIPWNDAIFQRAGLGHYSSTLRRQGFAAVGCTFKRGVLLFDSASKRVFMDPAYYEKKPASHLFHRLLFLLWSVRLRFYDFLHVDPRNDTCPFLAGIYSKGVSVEDVVMHQVALKRHLHQLILAETLDLVGMIESMTNTDLEASSESGLRYFASADVRQLLLYCRQINFEAASESNEISRSLPRLRSIA